MSEKGQRLHLFFCLVGFGRLFRFKQLLCLGFGWFFCEWDRGHLCAKKSPAAAQLSDSPGLGQGGPLVIVCGAGDFLMGQP